MSLFEVLLAALTLGSAASGLTLMLRSLAPISWLMVKPLGCDLCMSFWGTNLAAGAWWFALGRPQNVPLLIAIYLATLAAIPAALFVLRVQDRLLRVKDS